MATSEILIMDAIAVRIGGKKNKTNSGIMIKGTIAERDIYFIVKNHGICVIVFSKICISPGSPASASKRR